MWLTLPHAFLSFVAPQDDLSGPNLLVRARARGDIQRVFPDATVTHTPTNDYAYRALVPRTAVVDVVTATITTLDYPNFKATVREHDRHEAYLACWVFMRAFQHERTAKRRRRGRASSAERGQGGTQP